MKWMMMAVMAVATHPSTRPATRPALIDLKPLDMKVGTAKADLEHAREVARQEWESSSSYRKLKADVDQHRAVLDQTRAGTDSSAKLEASKLYNDSRLRFEAADKIALAGAKAIENAERAVRDAEKELEQTKRENDRRIAAFDDADPLRQAIKMGRIEIGMSLPEVRAVFKREGVVEFESAQSARYKFLEHKLPVAHELTKYRPVFVTFTDGKVSLIEYGVWSDRW